jgi:hypothetical protein
VEKQEYESRKQYIFNLLSNFLQDKESIDILKISIRESECTSNLRSDTSDFRQIILGLVRDDKIKLLEDTLKALTKYIAKVNMAGKSIGIKFSVDLSLDKTITIDAVWDHLSDRNSATEYFETIVNLEQYLLDKIGKSILVYAMPASISQYKLDKVIGNRKMDPSLSITDELKVHDGYNLEMLSTYIHETNYYCSDIFAYILVGLSEGESYEYVLSESQAFASELQTLVNCYLRMEPSYQIERAFTKYTTLTTVIKLKTASELIGNKMFIDKALSTISETKQEHKSDTLKIFIRNQLDKVESMYQQSIDSKFESTTGTREILCQVINELFTTNMIASISENTRTHNLMYKVNFRSVK